MRFSGPHSVILPALLLNAIHTKAVNNLLFEGGIGRTWQLKLLFNLPSFGGLDEKLPSAGSCTSF